MRWVIGISGASGVIYGIRLLEILHAETDIETHLVMTPTAKMNIGIETNQTIRQVEELADVVHNINDVAAPVASGSFKTDGMIIAPCSMKTLSAIVHSYADNLLVRAADVTLKENRKLVVMPRETPLHAGHCRLLYDAASLGVGIAPPMPAFYNKPQTLDELITYSVVRILDLFGLEVKSSGRWQGPDRSSRN